MYKIFLNDAQIDCVVKEFDRDNTGTIDFNEFAQALSVSLTKVQLTFLGFNE